MSDRAGRLGWLANLPIIFDMRAVSIEEGARAGLSLAALVVASSVLGAPVLLQAGLGALLTCLCDAGGPMRRRVPALLGFALCGAALTAGLGMLRPAGDLLILPCCVLIFAFSLLRIWGPAAQQVGSLLSVVLVLGLDRRFASPHAVQVSAVAFLGGALWAALLTLVIWRLHPNRPSRIAVSRVYAALAALADDLHALASADAAGQAQWDAHARVHRAAVRGAIEQARAVLHERLRRGGAASRPAAQNLIRLESADRILHTLVALSGLLEDRPAQDGGRREAGPPLDLLAGVLRGFAPHIVADRDEGLAALGAGIAALAAGVRALPQDGIRRGLERVVDKLRVALNLTGSVDAALPSLSGSALSRLWATLADNLHWASAPLRHATRTALVCAIGLLITFTWPRPYGHWLTITLVLTLQPYYALTLQRALERVGGTVAGGLLAALLALVCHGPLAIAFAITPLSMLALALRGVNFGLYIAALTPVIVLLVELTHAANGWTVALARGLYTIAGGALAVGGCIFLWPSWEPGRVGQELRAAVAAHGGYAIAELARLAAGRAAGGAWDTARRRAGVASNNLEASLGRAALEPGRAGRDRLEAASVVDATLRRVATRLSALHLAQPGEAPVMQAWLDWMRQVADSLSAPLPPPLPSPPAVLPADPAAAEALAGIARQLDICAGALRRYGEG